MLVLCKCLKKYNRTDKREMGVKQVKKFRFFLNICNIQKAWMCVRKEFEAM